MSTIFFLIYMFLNMLSTYLKPEIIRNRINNTFDNIAYIRYYIRKLIGQAKSINLQSTLSIDMAVTIRDIARRVGVTKATVSLVLTGGKSSVRISDTTRNKVLEAAKALNYFPSFHARALVKGRTFTLGLVIGEIHSPYYSELASLAMEEAESQGYHMLVSVTRWSVEKELECLDMLLRRRVDGILFATAALRPGVRQFDYLQEQKFPIAHLGFSTGFSSVRSDWEPGMDQAAEYLQGKGHRRIGFLVGSDFELVGDERRIALEASCAKRGLACEVVRCSPTIEAARLAGAQMTRSNDRPSAVIVQSDHLAIGLIRGLHDQAVHVPDGISIIGCDGTRDGESSIPSLTTIAQDLRRQVRESVEIVLQMIANREMPRKDILIPTKLIVRDSA
ncbi:MAG: LacI family DNA-binding transcriptional regulator [Phycisphaerae bacterium]|nr:LacI family DNA-binding transcriptional regulator [Phycisphaerae bacterium]